MARRFKPCWMVMHLMYDDMTTPIVAGIATRNKPE
jgi:hypothetical protein